MSNDRETVAQRAVRAFHEAKDALLDFLSDPEIREIMLEHEHLVKEHNQTLDQAMRAIKSELRSLDQDKLIIDGLGAQKKWKRYYDADHLAKALPAEQSDLVLTERVIYEVNREVLEQMMRQGEIDNEIVEQAYHEDEQNPANLPGTPKPYVIPALPVLE
jgi:hypothetical protein